MMLIRLGGGFESSPFWQRVCQLLKPEIEKSEWSLTLRPRTAGDVGEGTDDPGGSIELEEMLYTEVLPEAKHLVIGIPIGHHQDSYALEEEAAADLLSIFWEIEGDDEEEDWADSRY